MRKSLLLALLCLVLLSASAMGAGVTPSSPSPADDATNVWVNTPTLTVVLNEADGETMNGTMTLVATGDTYTISTMSNGTSSLTIASANLPLTASTTYQWYVNVSNETGVWTNTTYNFTTGTPARLSENTGFDTSQLLLIAFLSITVLLVIVFMVIEVMDGKPDLKRLFALLIAVIILVIAMGFI